MCLLVSHFLGVDEFTYAEKRLICDNIFYLFLSQLYQCFFRGPAESWQKLQDILKNQTTAAGPLIGRSECTIGSR